MISLDNPLDERQKSLLLGVHKSLNLTKIRCDFLASYFSSWEEVFYATVWQLQESGLDPKGIERFVENRKTVDPERELEELRKCNAEIILFGSKNYPLSLSHIHDPPVILFGKGVLNASDFPSISVVGSRKISPYGKRVTESIVKDLAREGICIVSGLAFGVDTLAHQTAVMHGARTIAVLGTGIDMITPVFHQKFAQRCIEDQSMVVLSEFFPGTPGNPENFPRRNRIITGLSKATIVVEGAMKSGSLISANLALEQDREVFAVPGDIFSPTSQGCNQLIADNIASPALSGSQVLDQLGIKNQQQHRQAQIEIPESGIEADIFGLFEHHHPYHIDDLSRRSTLSHQQITATLILMEMKGLVRNMGMQTYVRNI